MPIASQAVSSVAQTSESRMLQARSFRPFNRTMARSSGFFASMRRIAEGLLKNGTVEAAIVGKKEKSIAALGRKVGLGRSVSAKETIQRHAESAATKDHKTPERQSVLVATKAEANAAANVPSSASLGLRPTHPLGRL